MQLSGKYKAILITILTAGIVGFSVFSLHLKKQSGSIAETFYDIEPFTEEELKKIIEETQDLKSPSTNKASGLFGRKSCSVYSPFLLFSTSFPFHWDSYLG